MIDRRFVLAFAALFLGLTPISAVPFGDVEVTVESEPEGEATHGYAEIWVRVVNRSPQQTRTVRLTFPRSSYNPRDDHLRAVSRTVVLEPGATARVSLAYPEKLTVVGSGLGVTIDGTQQENDVHLNAGRRGSSLHSYGGFGGYGTSMPQPLVLYSRDVATDFPDWVGLAHQRILLGETPDHGAGLVVIGSPEPASCVRAGNPVATWSTNWLGYSRYDGIVITAGELNAMSAEVRNAIGQYVECGGSLLVLGSKATLPGPWKPDPGQVPGLTRYSPGFGQCVVTPDTDLSSWTRGPGVDRMSVVFDSWKKTLSPWQREASPVEANRRFPVVDDLGVPVKGLLALMFVFAVAIGPVNLYLLARRRRKIWLFWTVPLISFVTCLTVFVYMAVAEGWKGKARVEGFTVLDENTRRASTVGWYGFYTPLLPGSGLHFSPNTEVTLQNGDDSAGYYRRRSGSALSIDWTADQHLASGWMTPRVPAHFVVRKGELRRERVTFRRGADGRPEAVNGLGADLTDLWYADDTGQLFHVGNVPAGGTVSLSPIPRPEATTRTLRDIYAADWSSLVESLKSSGPGMLWPRTYLAIMDAAPFLDEGLSTSGRRARSAVLGIIKEGGDGG